MPAGMIASAAFDPAERVDAPLHHAVAAPGEDELGAILERALDLLRRLPALRHLVPDRLRDTLSLELASKLEQAAPDATCPHARPPRPSLLTPTSPPPALRVTTSVTRASKSASSSAAIPMSAPRSTSVGWCMPRYIREQATKGGTASATHPDEHLQPRRGHPRCQEEREARVERERGRRMTRRVARVDRQGFEPVDVGPVAVHEEDRRPVRARLDEDRGEDEACDQPALPENSDDHDGADERRDEVAAGDLRPDERGVVPERRAVAGEPAHEPLVRRLEAVDRDDPARERESDERRDECERGPAEHEPGGEDRRGVPGRESVGDVLGRASRSRLERRKEVRRQLRGRLLGRRRALVFGPEEGGAH